MIKRTLVIFFATIGLLAAQQPAKPKKPEFHPVLPPGTQVHRDLQYVVNGGPKRSLDLYLPEKVSGKLPAVVWIHGGAWRSGDKNGWSPAFSLLSKGYALAIINYRFPWVDKAPFPAQLNDCKASIRWLRAHATEYTLDPDHIGVWGHSAGGHLVAMLGVTGTVPQLEGTEGNLQYSSAVQAVCDWSGPTDLALIYRNNPQDHNGAVVQLLGGGDIKAATEEKAAKASPLTYVNAKAAPFLIVHGAKDPVVSPTDSEKLNAALKAVGVESTYISVPDAAHGIGGPELEKQAADFFDRHLKPSPVPAK